MEMWQLIFLQKIKKSVFCIEMSGLCHTFLVKY